MPTKLTKEEWNALTKLAEHTGMDCWFSLKEKEERDVIYDIEHEKFIELEDGLLDFAEGLMEDDLNELGLIPIWNSICDKFLGGIHKY
jgi:hypothetical protein